MSYSVSTTKPCCYYDLDDILAEEEMIPITTLFNFHHLAHLDPNYLPPVSSSSQQQSHEQSQDLQDTDNDHNKTLRKRHSNSSSFYLAQNTKIQMPLWSIRTWSQLGFLKLGMPKPFTPKVRQRLLADPIRVDLHSKSPWYYMAGIHYIHLVQHSYATFRDMYSSRSRKTNANGGSSSYSSAQLKEWNTLSNQVKAVQQTLLHLFSTSRFRVLFDWTLSDTHDDDLSAFTSRLTCMELNMFHCGAEASQAFALWKLYGSSRIVVSDLAVRIRQQANHDRHKTLSTSLLSSTGGTKRTSQEPKTSTTWNQPNKVLAMGAKMGDSFSRKRPRLTTT